MRTHFATARAATALSALALLSPVAGMAVEVALAWRYGISSVADAYRIGSVMVLMGQQLLVQQFLPHILVPVFARCAARGNTADAWRAAQGVGNVFLLVSAVLGVGVFLWPRPAVWLLAEGLHGEARAQATIFIRWLALAYMPLVITGIATSLLYAERIFWLPAAVQLLRNLLLAGVILMFPGGSAGPLLFATLGAVLLGAALTAARLWPLARRDGARLNLRLSLRHPDVRLGVALSVPLVGMFVAGQWSPIIINRALTSLAPGSVASFGYAFKIGLLISLAPLALATVLFPRFAEEHSASAREKLEALGTRGLRMGVFLAIPLTAALIALREPVVSLLFKRGAFGASAVTEVARLVGLLLLSTPAAVIAAHAQKMLYARQKNWTPTLAALAGCAILMLLCPWTAQRWGAVGVAVLFTALSWAVAGAQLIPIYGWRSLSALRAAASFVFEMALLGGASGWFAAAIGLTFSRWAGGLVTAAFFGAAVGCLGACALFFAGSAALAMPETVACVDFLRWQSLEWRRRMLGLARSA
jgi:putative peptidoglycan lipid II flippase